MHYYTTITIITITITIIIIIIIIILLIIQFSSCKAPNGHTNTQFLHSVHPSKIVICMESSNNTWAGHTPTQAPQ